MLVYGTCKFLSHWTSVCLLISASQVSMRNDFTHFNWIMHFLISWYQSEPRGTLAHHLTLAPSSDTSTSNSTFSPTTVWTSSSSLVMVIGGSTGKIQSFESNFKTAERHWVINKLCCCVMWITYCTAHCTHLNHQSNTEREHEWRIKDAWWINRAVGYQYWSRVSKAFFVQGMTKKKQIRSLLEPGYILAHAKTWFGLKYRLPISSKSSTIKWKF